MQTYYKLEDYHWREINKKGFVVGAEVWFFNDSFFDDPIIKNGIIVGHDISIEGDILLKIEVIEKLELDEFSTKENIIKTTKESYLSFTSFDREEVVKRFKTAMYNRIKRCEIEIKFFKKQIEKVE